jgi:hypothetical protein
MLCYAGRGEGMGIWQMDWDGRTLINSLIWRFCRRASRSRCSDAVRLYGGFVNFYCSFGNTEIVRAVPSVHSVDVIVNGG